MAVKDVTRDAVESALAEFRRTNLQAMLERYGGGPSTKWYVQDGNLLYDQKLVVRAAHVLQGLGDLYPRGPGSFDAAQALSLLDRLDYRVVSKLSPTNANLEGPSATEPLARWLIGAARQVPPATLTYGEAASRLEKECGSSRIPRASRVGRTAASLQYAIHARDPSAPLLNVLLVRQDTGLTASGAQEFLAARYPEETRLAEKGAATALELVAADQRLKLHVRVVENAMDLADLLRQVPTDDEDMKVIQVLGMRTFNAFGASLKLVLSGYSQNSALIVRDILETVFLLNLFSGDRTLIGRWRVADDRTRKRGFSPVAVRKALDERDGFEGRKREEIYRMFSELAAHPTMKSVYMMRPQKDGDAVIGPFIAADSLEAVLSEMGRLAVQVGEVLDHFFPETQPDVRPAREDYARGRLEWLATFFPPKPPAAATS